MKKFYLFTLLFTMVNAVQAKSVEKMTVEEKCGVFRDAALLYLDNYFKGQSREQQYDFVEGNTRDKVTIVFNKKLIDTVYDYIPFTMVDSERKAYKEAHSSIVFDKCMRTYNNSK